MTISPPVKHSESHLLLPGILAFVALALAVFWPALHGGFVWDDYILIVNNDIIHASDGLRRFWFSTEPWDYFPLTNSLFWIEWRLFGNDTLGYHLVSVLLHVGSAVFIWRTLRRLAAPMPWICAALFVVHPVNVESVAYISELKNTLSFFICTVAVYAFVRFDETQPNGARRRWYALSLIAYFFALLAKTSVVPIPLFLLALPWLRRGRITRKDLLATAPLFAIAMGLALATMWFQAHRAIGGDAVRTDGMASRIAVAGCAVWFYFGKVLWPADCMLIYPIWKLDPHNPIVFAPAILAAGALAGLYFLRRNLGRGPIVAAGYYALMLLPILGFVNIYFMKFSLVSDHWQYPAIIGGIVLAVGMLRRILSPMGARLSTAALACFIGICVLISNGNAHAWADSRTLWIDAENRDPGNWVTHRQVAAQLAQAGMNEQALAELMTAYRQAPEVADTSLEIGVRLQTDGDPRAALPWYVQGVKNLPSGDDPRMRILRATGFFDLGWGYDGAGQPAPAMEYYRQAIALDPQNIQARTNLGVLYFKAGQYDQAIAQYQSALATFPDFISARINLGNALLAQGKGDEAIAQWRAALATEPQNVKAMTNIGAVLAKRGELPAAIAMFKEALAVDPDYADAQRYLAIAQAKLASQPAPVLPSTQPSPR